VSDQAVPEHRTPDSKPPAAQGHRTARLLARIGIAGVALLVVIVGVAFVWVNHYWGNVHKVPLPPKPSQSPGAIPEKGENFLLVGSDTRQGVGGGFGSPTSISGQRSDTVILAHLPAHGKPTLVSFPRDSYVLIPSYTDSHGVTHPAHMDKLNTAYSLGGYRLLVRTIEQLSGLGIDHYLEVNFAGFKKMVDAVGGVTLCARTTRNDPANGPQGGSNDFMTAGVHKNVSGAVALAFVRDRHSFANEDISRIQDQQYFIKQLIGKVESVGVLLNPIRLNNFLSALSSSIRVDQGLTLNGVRSLISRLHNTDPNHVRFVTLPFATSNGTADIGGAQASVVLLDKAKDDALFNQLRTDKAGRSSAKHHHKVGVSGKSLTCGA
jgi:LCP family protein required for cell wall assembly